MYNQNIGRFGEELARDYLTRRGYRIIDFNIKTSYKEIDIVAEAEGLLVFVEVKTRTSNKLGRAEESIHPQKINHLTKAIGIYLSKSKHLKFKDLRVDLVAIDIDKIKRTAKIKHYKGIV